MKLKNTLVIAVSSRALFDLSESHQVFIEKSLTEFEKYQKENEHVVLKKGHAFNFIEKLLKLNNETSKLTNDLYEAVEIILISQNSVSTGRQIINSIKHYGLGITRFVFTCGDSPAIYLTNDDINLNLYLAHEKKYVEEALDLGIPAATIMSAGKHSEKNEIRFGFDGDAVIFSDESESIYQNEGLDRFHQNETELKDTPLNDGPLKPLYLAIGELRDHYPHIVKIGLITARGGLGIDRVLNSFDHWNLTPDHACFLGGVDKGYFLKSFHADIFFDDHMKHCIDASEHVATCHVPNGINAPTSALNQK